jgi:hypothetical protein
MHAFQIVSYGPPAFTARCTCAWWHLAWDADELQRRAFTSLAAVEQAARAEHADHALRCADREERAARTADFY